MAKQQKRQPVQVVVLPPVYRQPRPGNSRAGSRRLSAQNGNDNHALLRGWSKQYGRPITPAELDEINHNLAHLFSLLLSWERQFTQQGLLPKADESTNP